MKYYDLFSHVYDILAPAWYYHKPRKYAVEKLNLRESKNVIVLPCGTGQSFRYLINQLHGEGNIIGIDYSNGMLRKVRQKITKHGWENITTFKKDATKLNRSDIVNNLDKQIIIDAIYLELGLSTMPEWKKVIDNALSLLKEEGKIVIMDWYMENTNLWGKFINSIGNAEIRRPTWKYLKKKVENFKINNNFKNGGVFVASGNKS